jgi:hypothetical protein
MSSVQLALAAGVPYDVVIRLMRVYGESLRRVADAETAIYHNYFELPLLGGVSVWRLRASGKPPPITEAKCEDGRRVE